MTADNPTTAALRALAAQDPTVTSDFHVVTLTDFDGIDSPRGADAEAHTLAIFQKWSKQS